MGGATKPTEYYEASVFWNAPARNFRSSARLHLQHLLNQNTLGFLLERNVEEFILSAPGPSIRIADLACGNGAWLTDLSHELAVKGISAQLNGFDINDTVFPAPAFLPQTVSLKKLDILTKPLPQELIGAYDAVHVRTFVTLILNANTTPLLSNIFDMLKPGGWLQWEEMRPGFLIEPATPDLSTTACETLSQIIKAGAEAKGLSYDFLTELDQHLIKHGFQDARMFKTANRRQDYKGWTDDFLMIWEELGVHFPSKVTEPQAAISREFWHETFEKAVGETEKGVAIHQGPIITAVGRKPM